MQIQITARHFTASDKLTARVEERLGKLEKYYDGITHAHVVLSQPGGAAQFEAELILNVFRKILTADARESSYEEAVDRCADRMRRQLKRYKDWLRDTDRDEHK